MDYLTTVQAAAIAYTRKRRRRGSRRSWLAPRFSSTDGQVVHYETGTNYDRLIIRGHLLDETARRR